MRRDERTALLDVFLAALEAVNGRRCVSNYLAAHPFPPPVYLIAIGKVACPMARGAVDALGDRIQDALVITKRGHGEPLPWPVIETSHPVPDETCLAAGAKLHAYIAALPPDASVLALLSGGASALVEQLPPGANLETLRQLNQWLLASGRDIAAVNRVRKRLSLVKGGRLALALAPRPVTCLAISDVQGDDPRYIGSGMLVPDDTVNQEPIDDAPPTLRTALLRAPPAPSATDSAFAHVRYEIIARLADAKAAAGAAANANGLRVALHDNFVAGDAHVAGAQLAELILSAPTETLHIWGGETTVTLPREPGRGGRNQSLALAAARVLKDRSAFLLSAGTDGTDGPTLDAGALVDGGTIERGEQHGQNAELALARADAGTFLEASGDLIHTGPTGTNVMDLMLGWRS